MFKFLIVLVFLAIQTTFSFAFTLAEKQISDDGKWIYYTFWFRLSEVNEIMYNPIERKSYAHGVIDKLGLRSEVDFGGILIAKVIAIEALAKRLEKMADFHLKYYSNDDMKLQYRIMNNPRFARTLEVLDYIQSKMQPDYISKPISWIKSAIEIKPIERGYKSSTSSSSSKEGIISGTIYLKDETQLHVDDFANFQDIKGKVNEIKTKISWRKVKKIIIRSGWGFCKSGRLEIEMRDGREFIMENAHYHDCGGYSYKVKNPVTGNFVLQSLSRKKGKVAIIKFD